MRNKILTSILLLASLGGVGTMVQVSAATPSPQVRIQIGRGRRHYRDNYRVVTQTRFVRRGPWRFRETYRVTYFPNGSTQTTLISRDRVY